MKLMSVCLSGAEPGRSTTLHGYVHLDCFFGSGVGPSAGEQGDERLRGAQSPCYDRRGEPWGVDEGAPARRLPSAARSHDLGQGDAGALVVIEAVHGLEAEDHVQPVGEDEEHEE